MNLNPKVSIIVTCYNQGKYLMDSINSIRSQTWENWECLIINDGSTDDSLIQARKFKEEDSRISVFSQENAGVSSARNFGLSLVKGEFIQFLDADDFIHSEKLRSQLEVFEKFPEVDLCFGSSRYFFDGSPKTLFPMHPTGAIPVDLTKNDHFQVEMIFKNNVCSNCSLLIKRTAIENVRFRQVIYEDWIFNLELALNKFIFHYDPSFESYSYIRMTKDSLMNQHTAQKSKYKEFEKCKSALIKEYGYPINKDILKLVDQGLNSSLKSLVKNWIPPILYDALANLKKSF